MPLSAYASTFGRRTWRVGELPGCHRVRHPVEPVRRESHSGSELRTNRPAFSGRCGDRLVQAGYCRSAHFRIGLECGGSLFGIFGDDEALVEDQGLETEGHTLD